LAPGYFIFYILIRQEAGWGESRAVRKIIQHLMFSARGELPIITILTRQDGKRRPFFIILPKTFFAVKISLFWLKN
jgi:hypothetical protein